MVEPIRKTIDVKCDPATAFNLFVNHVGDWWPLATNSVSGMSGKVARQVTIEPRAGGKMYETMHDGTLADWAVVKTFEQDRKIVLGWYVMSPPEKATEVDITFASIGDGTRVTLVHSGWEVLAEDAQQRRDSYNNGWVNVFETAFANACKDAIAAQ